MLQGLSQSVVVEPYQASAECTEFSVTVIGSSRGPVALLPTEAEAFDMDDDIVEAALELEAFKARKEVRDAFWNLRDAVLYASVSLAKIRSWKNGWFVPCPALLVAFDYAWLPAMFAASYLLCLRSQLCMLNVREPIRGENTDCALLQSRCCFCENSKSCENHFTHLLCT